MSRATLERLDAVARGLVERALPAELRIATSADEIAAVQRLRGQALIERGWATLSDLEDGREEEPDDARATHILAFVDGALIGTSRLVFPEPGRFLPMEDRPGATPIPRPAVELGRIVVDRSARSQRLITGALVGRAWLELRSRGFERICGTVSLGMLRLYRRLGFLIEIIGPPVVVLGEERFPVIFEPTDAAADAAASASDG